MKNFVVCSSRPYTAAYALLFCPRYVVLYLAHAEIEVASCMRSSVSAVGLWHLFYFIHACDAVSVCFGLYFAVSYIHCVWKKSNPLDIIQQKSQI